MGMIVGGLTAAIAASAVFAAAGGAVNGHASAQAICPAAEVGAARCHALVISDGQGNPAATASPTGYGPTQFHTAYDLPTTSSTVQTIAIVDAYDDPSIRNDLTVYDQTFGIPNLPTCASPTQAAACFVKVNQNGVTGSFPHKNSGWALEIALDVETAHQICQNCKIVLVEASSNSFANLGTAENMAASLGANVISNSYGGSESSGETSYDSYYNHPGTAVTASTGDSGYGVQYPAASQYVVGVGGTTLNLNADGTRSSETAWSGAGSGCSAYEPKPSWQTSATQCARKAVADVSADANPNTGAAVYDTTPYNGQAGWFQVGGTSLASPLIAAVYALSGTYTTSSSQYSASMPWSNPSSLFDVTSGSNGTCSTAAWCTAGTGWDGPSGLGSPTGTNGF